MRSVGFYTIAVMLLTAACGMIGCKPQQEKKPDRQTAASQDTATVTVPRTIDYQQLYDDLDHGIGGLSPDQSDLKKDALVAVAWDTVSGGFFCPGKAVMNPKLPEAARAASLKRGAQLTAERWALLLRQWKIKEYRSIDEPIQGRITYSNVVFEKQVGDTLIMLVLVPLGSIVVEQGGY